MSLSASTPCMVCIRAYDGLLNDGARTFLGVLQAACGCMQPECDRMQAASDGKMQAACIPSGAPAL